MVPGLKEKGANQLNPSIPFLQTLIDWDEQAHTAATMEPPAIYLSIMVDLVAPNNEGYFHQMFGYNDKTNLNPCV